MAFDLSTAKPVTGFDLASARPVARPPASTIDLSQLSDTDLLALNAGDLSKVSDAGLKLLAGSPQSEWDSRAALPSNKDIYGSTPSQPAGNFLGSKTGGFIRGLRDIPDGLAQVLYNLEPSGMQSALDKADAWLHQNTGGLIGNQTGGTFNDKIAADNNAYEQSRAANGRDGTDWMRVGGNMAGSIMGTAPLGWSGLLGASALGAGTNAAMPVTSPGDFWGQKATQAEVGAVGGFAGGVLGKMGSKLLNPQYSPDVQTLLNQNIRLTPGQIIGGIPQSIESKATSIPFLGDMIKNAQGRAVQDLNTAALNRALNPIGETATATGRQGLDSAIDTLGNAYDKTLANIGAVKTDPQFMTDTGNLSQLTSFLPPERANQFQSILKSNVLDNINPQGFMTSDAFQNANSKLGSLGRQYLGSADADQRQLGSALMEAQNTLRQNLARLSPDNAAQLSKINEGYANLLRVQRASAMAGTEKTGGLFSPGQLNSAVKGMDSSLNDRAYARGDALMQDLSGPATRVMGNNYPDSGTAGRSMLGWLGSGALAAFVKPELATPLMWGGAFGGMGALPYTKLGGAITRGLLASRPEMVRAAGQALGDNVAPMGLLAAPATAAYFGR